MRLGLSAAVVLLSVAGCARETRMPPDPQIAQMVRDVDPVRLEATVRTLVGFGTRHTLSETDDERRGIGAARRWIESQLRDISKANGGRLIVHIDGYRQEPDGRRIVKPVDILNVTATLPGTQRESTERLYVVAAHYDSIPSDPTDYARDAPGANDDASGTAAVLEAARIMSAYEFDATIVFMLVAGEEQGLFGSRYAAGKMRREKLNVAGMFTNDIIGSSLSADGVRDRGHVRVFSEGVPLAETPEQREIRQRVGSENDSAARQLARYVDEICASYLPNFDVVLIYRIDRFLRGGDHKSFALEGYPAIRFTEMNEDYRHQHQNVRMENGVQYGDLPEFVDFAYTADVTRVNIAALASLARAPAKPSNARVITAGLSNSTTLRWNANTEPDLAGYEIVWRETTAPQWQHSTKVGGDVTEHEHPLSKDNYVFGVRAVDSDGHRSEAAYPLPSKN